jgi:alpha-ketoglutarate-dependent 2,4-dichlorophenoxyacetate dioxygenase
MTDLNLSNKPMARPAPASANAADSSDLRVRPVNAGFVGIVDKVKLDAGITDAQRDAIERAMDRFAVLVFPDQHLDDEKQFALGSRFGAIEDAASGTHQDRRRLANAQVNDISNLNAAGTIMAADDRHRMSSLGNLLWHSDSSFKAVPARYSMLHARVLPPAGGDTEFADMRAAWDALPDELKQKARDLVCDHSMLFSRGKIGFTDFSDDERLRCTPVPQRLVRRHRHTGRLSLFLSSHIGRIHGWQTPESLLFIQDLVEFATQPQFVYRHTWRVNDLVIWDNEATMHRGRAFDSHKYPRDLRRVTVAGRASTLDDAPWGGS